VKAIREACTKRVLGMIEDLAKLEKRRGRVDRGQSQIREVLWRIRCRAQGSLGEDFANRDRLAKAVAVRLHPVRHSSVSLADYKARMKEGQEAIYYITAETLAAAKNSPQLRSLPQEGHRGLADDGPGR